MPRPRTWRRRRWSARGGTSTASRAGRHCGRRCTGSPPTSAWTLSPPAAARRCRWTCPVRDRTRGEQRTGKQEVRRLDPSDLAERKPAERVPAEAGPRAARRPPMANGRAPAASPVPRGSSVGSRTRPRGRRPRCRFRFPLPGQARSRCCSGVAASSGRAGQPCQITDAAAAADECLPTRAVSTPTATPTPPTPGPRPSPWPAARVGFEPRQLGVTTQVESAGARPRLPPRFLV